MVLKDIKNPNNELGFSGGRNLSEFDPNIVSYLSRKIRDDKKLTQEKAAFGGVSKGTIHNIETQEKPVSNNTILEHFENLGIYKVDFPNRLLEAKKNIDDTQFQLNLIQMLLDGGDLDPAKNELKKLKLPKYHPLSSFCIYLEGRYWFHQGEWEKASRDFTKAINRYRKNQYKLNNQLVPHCYNLLGLCSYYQDDVKNAIKYAELGLEANPKAALKNSIMSNIILYLSHSGNSTQAFYLINNFWSEINQSSKIATRLNLYVVRTKLLRSAKQITEAIDCAKEGLELAFINHEYNRAFELLNTLGIIYIEENEWEQAERCFSTVIQSNKSNSRRIAEATLNMGILHAHKRNWKLAETYLAKSLEICRDNKLIDYNLKSDVHIVYGRILFFQNKYHKALEVLSELEKSLNGSEEHFEKAISLSLNCLLSLGDIDEFQKRSVELFKLRESSIRKDEFYEIPSRWRR